MYKLILENGQNYYCDNLNELLNCINTYSVATGQRIANIKEYAVVDES